jgi:hypothetical protein
VSASTPEGKVKHAIKQVLEELGIYYHMPVQNGMGKRSLDFICCVGGHYVGIEAKAPGKHPTRMQEKLMVAIINSGGTCFTIDGTETQGLHTTLGLIKERALVMKALEE